MTMCITEWVTIARSGPTIDGREIPASVLMQIAESYNPATYTAVLNMCNDYRSGDKQAAAGCQFRLDPGRESNLLIFQVMPLLATMNSRSRLLGANFESINFWILTKAVRMKRFLSFLMTLQVRISSILTMSHISTKSRNKS